MAGKKQIRNSKLNNSLRIIGGLWRGRKFSFPSAPGLRPTSDRIRETLFNWLNPVIREANCLDLFAGSGALSLEALSRGASHVTMIDNSRDVMHSLHQYLSSLECNKATLLNVDTIRWLNQSPDHAPFNIVFLDPPFLQDLISPCCKLLEDNRFLMDGSYIYIESEHPASFVVPDTWLLYRSKIAGDVAYSLYIKQV
jgi:16S rRNA (guanine966-N2)-methyltransferase